MRERKRNGERGRTRYERTEGKEVESWRMRVEENDEI